MQDFREPGELVNLAPLREERANQICLWGKFILDILDRPDVPADLREKAARILKLAPAEVVTPQHEPEPLP